MASLGWQAARLKTRQGLAYASSKAQQQLAMHLLQDRSPPDLLYASGYCRGLAGFDALLGPLLQGVRQGPDGAH